MEDFDRIKKDAGKMVASAANHIFLNIFDQDDLHQSALLALVEAEESFEQSDAKWTTFAHTVMQNAICSELRKLRLYRKLFIVTDEIGDEKKFAPRAITSISRVAREVFWEEVKEVLHNAIQFKVIEKKFKDNAKAKDIARQLDLPVRQVSDLNYQAIKTLRKEMR